MIKGYNVWLYQLSMLLVVFGVTISWLTKDQALSNFIHDDLFMF